MYLHIKRILDVVIAACALVALGPILLGLSLVVRMSSHGPALYRGPRVGLHGKTFHILKFRTMVAEADKIGGPSAAGDDPRITSVGSFLRKWKLDELPQLVNVLIGEMSLVGPRPEVRRWVDLYTEREAPILTVRPGITDWASIWNSNQGAVLAGHPDPDRAYEELIRPTKLELQLKYVRECSFWTDSRILVSTVRRLVGGHDWMPRELEPYGCLPVAQPGSLQAQGAGPIPDRERGVGNG